MGKMRGWMQSGRINGTAREVDAGRGGPDAALAAPARHGRHALRGEG